MKWLRPRYPTSVPSDAYHYANRVGSSYVTACNGRWSTRDVTDELVDDGVGSGKYATRKCCGCVAASEKERTDG